MLVELDSVTYFDFIDVGNFEVGIYFRDRRVYETGLIAIRDESPVFCAGSSHGKLLQAPILLQSIQLVVAQQ